MSSDQLISRLDDLQEKAEMIDQKYASTKDNVEKLRDLVVSLIRVVKLIAKDKE